MPGAGRIPAGIDGGPLKGGAPRVVWQALDADPRTVPAGRAAQRLDQLGRAGHLVWNPIHGEIVQQIPILRAGRSLGWPGGLNPGVLPTPGVGAIGGAAQQAAAGSAAGGTGDVIAEVNAEINAEGRLCVQICVVAFACDPFTSRPMLGLAQILDWLDSWRIPRQWPAGRPAAFPHEQAACRDRRLWARGGHFGASQVPGLTAVGPGAVDVELLTGWTGQARPPAQVGQAGPSGRAGHAGHAAARARVPLASARAEENGPAASGIRDLDGYFDSEDASAAAATLSPVG